MYEGTAKQNAWKTKQEVSHGVLRVKEIILEKWNHVAQEANSNGLHSHRL